MSKHRVVAEFNRHHSSLEEEFDTYEEAIRFLASGEVYEELSANAIRFPDYTIAGKRLGELLAPHERALEHRG